MLVEEDSNENIFELQHHHLLRCLEKTTVKMIIFIRVFIPSNACNKTFQDREFVDMDLPFNGTLTCMELYPFMDFDFPTWIKRYFERRLT